LYERLSTTETDGRRTTNDEGNMTAEDAMTTRENEDDLYAALGVGRDATKTEVGFAFF